MLDGLGHPLESISGRLRFKGTDGAVAHFQFILSDFHGLSFAGNF